MSIPSYRLHKATGQAVVTLLGKDHYLGKYGTDDSRRIYDELVAEFQAGKVRPKPKRSSPNPDGPAYRLHKQSGQAIVTISGRDYYLGPHNSSASKAEYYRLKHEYFASGCSPNFGAKLDKVTVVEVLAGYKKHCLAYYGSGPESEWHRVKPVLTVLKTLYGTTNATEFGPLQFEAVRSRLKEPSVSIRKDKSRRVVLRTRTYINSQMKRVIAIFRWATSKSILPVTIYQTLKTVEPLKAGRCDVPESEPVIPVPVETVEATLPHLNHVVRSMVELQARCGARPGEICCIKPSMVDRSLEKTRGVWVIHYTEHKTAWRGKKRSIPLGAKAQEILKPFLLLRASDDYCFSPAEATKRRLEERHANRKTPENCGNVPGSNVVKRAIKKPGAKYNTQSYGHSIRKACEKAGIEPWAPNRIRHSYATSARKAYGLEIASVLLGHSEIGITQVYAEQDFDAAIDAARKLG